MSVSHKTILTPTVPIPPDAPPAPPPDPLAQAEALLARFAAGGWLMSTRSANGTQADNRAVLNAAIGIALAYELRTSAEMIVSELRRIAAKEQTL